MSCKSLIPLDLIDFSTSFHQAAFTTACQNLNLRSSGTAVTGFTGRSLSGEVSGPAQLRTWLKITALRGTSTNWFREGEASAPSVSGVVRPRLLRVHDWIEGDLYYRALETSLSPVTAIGYSPLAETGTTITDHWIDAFKQSVLRLSSVSTRRYRIRPDAVMPHLIAYFGPDVPCIANEWSVAHGDCSWGNLTAPGLTFLDWELWGLAPRGFDLAFLLAFSASNRPLRLRLQQAFASELMTPSGRVASLLACCEVLYLIDCGVLPTMQRESVLEMAREFMVADAIPAFLE